MTQVRFIGDPARDHDGPDEITLCGRHFVKGEWTEVSGDTAARLVKHSHFEADADENGEPDPEVADLRAQLDAKGIAWHPRAGVKRLSAQLAEAQD